jgi:hypothetical protein
MHQSFFFCRCVFLRVFPFGLSILVGVSQAPAKPGRMQFLMHNATVWYPKWHFVLPPRKKQRQTNGQLTGFQQAGNQGPVWLPNPSCTGLAIVFVPMNHGQMDRF